MTKIYKHLLAILVCSALASSSYAQKTFPSETTKAPSLKAIQSNQYESNIILIKLKHDFKASFKSANSKLLNEYLQKEGIKITSATKMFNDIPEQKKAEMKGDFDRELYWVIVFESKITLDVVLSKVNSLPFIEFAEACKKIQSLIVPNDPMADTTIIDPQYQWHLKTIHAYEAWDIEKGDSANVVTAISDVGTQYDHPDLINNLKRNLADPIDNLDNDGDGLKDNYYGWDFGSNDNIPLPDGPGNDFQHGTNVAGCGFMTPNNAIGGAGTGYNCKFVPLKTSNTALAIIAGYQTIAYAALKKFKVLNISWGSTGGYSQIEQDAINNAVANDVLVIAAAGNEVAEKLYYPASYENVLSVAASDINDKMTTTRSRMIDICAPGTGVWTTVRNNSYLYSDGSSFAAPMVAGAAAIVRSHFPSYTNLQAAELLRVTADIIDTLPDNKPYKYLIGHGRLNMYKALSNSNAISLRTKQRTAKNSQNRTVVANDTGLVVCQFINYLAPSSNVVTKIRSSSPYITLIDSISSIPSMGTLATATNSNPFKFIVKQDAPNNFSIDFTLLYDNSAGYQDYENFTISGINPNYIDLDTNQIRLTITNTGRLGFSDPNVGSGLVYKNANLIFNSGIIASTSNTKISNCVVNAANTDFDNDFTALRSSNYFRNNIADQYIYNIISDDPNPGKIGLEINQRSYARKNAPNDKFVIIEYRIKNTSGAKLDSLNFGVFTDWDLPATGVNDPAYYTKNRGIWDNTNKIGVSYNTGATGIYGGTALLTNDKPIYYAIDNGYAPTYVYDGFSDAEKFLISSKGIGKVKSGLQQSIGNDISEMAGYTLFNIQPDEVRTVALAFIAGNDLIDIQTSAAAARTLFQQLKASPTPLLSNVTICKNQNTTIDPLNVGNFIVVDHLPPSSDTIYKGNHFVTGNLSKDTTFYVAGADSIFYSPFVNQKVTTSKPDGDFGIIPDKFTEGTYYFTNTDKGITSWFWDFGDDSTATTQNATHTYKTTGAYNVQLIIENALTCADTITKQVIVSKVTNVADQQLLNSISFFPNPAKEEITIKSVKAINLSISDLTGRVVLKAVQVEPDGTVDLTSLAAGTYLLQLQIDNYIKTEKLIIGY